jgi:hypothetical protein
MPSLISERIEHGGHEAASLPGHAGHAGHADWPAGLPTPLGNQFADALMDSPPRRADLALTRRPERLGAAVDELSGCQRVLIQDVS